MLEIVLTQREKDVLILIALGFINKNAAQELGASINTFNKHLASAKRKLQAKTKEQAVIQALKHQLISV